MVRNGTVICLIIVLGFFVGSVAGQVRSATVEVKGMSCPFCAFGVEKRLGAVAGVDQVIVSMKGGTTWFLAPGLQYVTRTFVLEGIVQLPVVQNLGPGGLKTDFILTVGIRIYL